MRKARLKKSHTPVDKSALAFGLPFKVESVKYRNSFHGSKCLVCGGTETTVGAHIRAGYFGIGKPSDDLTLPLCFTHHAEQHKVGEKPFWKAQMGWTIPQAKDAARQRFRGWKNG